MFNLITIDLIKGKFFLLSIRMNLGMAMPKLHCHIWISEGGDCCFSL